MIRTKISTIQYYTINGTTDSDSITSKSESTKKSESSDMSYQPSTNGNTTSSSLNKNNVDRGNKKNSNKYIQPNFIKYNPNNNITSTTYPSPKLQNRKLHQKKNTITTTLYEHQHQNTPPKKNIQYLQIK